MEKRICANCAHYYQHYIRRQRRFVEIHDGHCVAAPRTKNRTPDTPACDKFLPRPGRT